MIDDMVTAVQNYERVKREFDELKRQVDIAQKQFDEKKIKMDESAREVSAYEERVRIAAKAFVGG